jgi:hypothetical protein
MAIAGLSPGAIVPILTDGVISFLLGPYPSLAMRQLVTTRSVLRFLAPVIFLPSIYGACKKEVVAAPTPGSLVLVQGNNQQVQGGGELPNPIVVRLLGIDGTPIAKLPIGFAVATGGGTVTPGSGLTDENGEMKVKWTLGPNEVAQTLRATVSAIEPLTISALALLPSDIIVAQGNNQTAKAGAALPNPIVVRVTGPGNVPMKGITVAFQIVSGGGLISPQSGITSATGEVTARWTLGSAVGIQTLALSAGALQPLTLSAAAQ